MFPGVFVKNDQRTHSKLNIRVGTLGVTGVTPKRSSLLSFFLWVTLDQVTELVVVVFSIGVLLGGWGAGVGSGGVG